MSLTVTSEQTKERLSKIRESIVLHKAQFDYAFIFQRFDHDDDVELQTNSLCDFYESTNADKEKLDIIEDCQTCMCVAGFAVRDAIVTGHTPLPYALNRSALYLANEYLGIDGAMSGFLFCPRPKNITIDNLKRQIQDELSAIDAKARNVDRCHSAGSIMVEIIELRTNIIRSCLYLLDYSFPNPNFEFEHAKRYDDD